MANLIKKGNPAEHPFYTRGIEPDAIIMDHSGSELPPASIQRTTVVLPTGQTFELDWGAASKADKEAAVAWVTANHPQLGGWERAQATTQRLAEILAYAPAARQMTNPTVGSSNPWMPQMPMPQMRKAAATGPAAFPVNVDPFAIAASQGAADPLFNPWSPPTAPMAGWGPNPGAAAPQAPRVAQPPTVQVNFYLDGMTGSITCYYHDVQKQGAWLYLILDNHYPGASQFPIDAQVGTVTVHVAGHSKVYGCLPANNRFEFLGHTITGLIINEEQLIGD